MRILFSLFSALAVLCASISASADPVPVEYFALREAISNVAVSPDGKYMVLQKIESREGNPVIELYEANDLAKKPIRLAAEPMEFTGGLQWISDDIFVGVARQIVRRKIRGPEQDVRKYKFFAYSVEDGEFTEFPGNFGLEDVMPSEPNKILVSSGRANSTSGQDDPFAAFRPRAYYIFDLKRGSQSLVLKGSDKFPSAAFDDQANPRFAQGADPNTKELVNYYRRPGEKSWTEIGRYVDRDFFVNSYAFVGDKNGDPNTLMFLANNGNDKIGLWEFDATSKQFTNLVYRRDEADLLSVRFHSNSWGDDRNKITGVTYPGAKLETHWFDEEEKTLFEDLEAAIPNAHQISITSRSRDGDTYIVVNRGPRDPGSYYLVRDSSLAFLGNQYPLLKPEDLSDVEYIKYQARDGRTIPGYLTKPKGEGPFPLIVLPHGGPYVNEIIIYDEWSQLLANRGYMVLQPQYRGSTGYGVDHFFSSWRQHGYGMQDDKDDGALHLIRQGLVDKDRVAMFGWSYGGYAALVAASREPNIYQCVIAGAAVADPWLSYNGRRNDFFPFADEFARQRGAEYGINPMNEVSKVNVPILMVHGDVDRRVIYEHLKRYKKELEKNGKEAQYLTLEEADHFSNTLYYKHQFAFFTKMLDFLENDCGPGGL